jgi:ribosomal protein S27AE
MDDAELSRIQGAAETLQWGTDEEAAGWLLALVEEVRRLRGELNQSMPCPRCGRSDLLLKHLPRHAPCRSATMEEDDLQRELFDKECKVEDLREAFKEYVQNLEAMGASAEIIAAARAAAAPTGDDKE